MKKLALISVALTMLATITFGQVYHAPPLGLTDGIPYAKVQPKDPGRLTDDWQIMDSIFVDIAGPTGLTYDGQNFWITNYTSSANSCIYEVNPATGNVIRFIPSPDMWPNAITWDGEYLWVIDFVIGHATYDSTSLCKVDTADGTVLEMFHVEYSYFSGGLAWDGTYLYYGVQTEWATPCLCRVNKFDPATGAHLESFEMPNTHIHGMTYYDNYLWWSDDGVLELYQMTTAGTIMDQSPSPGPEPAGMAMEGENLCNMDHTTHWLYKMQIVPPDLSVILTPHDPPIQIPAGGGSFLFDVAIENITADPITADVWIETTPPGGTAIPLIVRTGITFPANATISRTDLVQNVPPGAPPGIYTYTCSVGEIFVSVTDFDQFTFEKLATGDGAANTGDWTLSGWEEEITPAESAPLDFVVVDTYPNPFNPTSTLSFVLRDGSPVNLKIYDLSGRLVASLIDGWRDAGAHEVTFDASHLVSGIYLYRLQAGEFIASGKMVLVK